MRVLLALLRVSRQVGQAIPLVLPDTVSEMRSIECAAFDFAHQRQSYTLEAALPRPLNDGGKGEKSTAC